MSALATYLNDHLAGSVSMILLLERLIASNIDEDFKNALEKLKTEIEVDQSTLRVVMQTLRVSESSFKKVMGWMAEKASRLKLSPDRSFTLLLAPEVIYVGITGKGALWRALACFPEEALQKFNLNGLEKRATSQRIQVEAFRLALARRLFRKRGPFKRVRKAASKAS